MLDHISQVLVALANGVFAGVTTLVSLRTLLVLGTLACLLWLAAVEVEEMDRQFDKPDIRLH